ncbi:hypothetical protein PG2103B_0183 [Bifidobacterium pseudolongum subsp. globosum]|nr:hypothetical protein PG2103B_0183 [Bifidobacterium pseudolongum subsp. globosum]
MYSWYNQVHRFNVFGSYTPTMRNSSHILFVWIQGLRCCRNSQKGVRVVNNHADALMYGTVENQRPERLIAEMIALSELVMIDESMPTPQTVRFSSSSMPTSHSTYDAASASVPTDIVCSA